VTRQWTPIRSFLLPQFGISLQGHERKDVFSIPNSCSLLQEDLHDRKTFLIESRLGEEGWYDSKTRTVAIECDGGRIVGVEPHLCCILSTLG